MKRQEYGSMFDSKKKRAVLIGTITFVILTAILISFFHHLDRNIFQVLSDTSLASIFVLIVCGCFYNFFDSCIYKTTFTELIPGFSFADSVSLTNLRVFGKTALIAGGAFPLQSYYLYKKGLIVGRCAGITSALYLIQKVSILFSSAILLTAEHQWIGEYSGSVLKYLWISYPLYFVVIFLLLLFCTSHRVCQLGITLIDKLPSSGKWPRRKEKWAENLIALFEEPHVLFRSRKKFFHIIVFTLCRLFVFYSIPYVCLKLLGTEPYTLLQVQCLTSLMLMISNVIPNVAGMGAPEVAFMLVFSESLGSFTTAALVFFRCSTYYFPFIISILFVIIIEKEMAKSKESQILNSDEHTRRHCN